MPRSPNVLPLRPLASCSPPLGSLEKVKVAASALGAVSRTCGQGVQRRHHNVCGAMILAKAAHLVDELCDVICGFQRKAKAAILGSDSHELTLWGTRILSCCPVATRPIITISTYHYDELVGAVSMDIVWGAKLGSNVVSGQFSPLPARPLTSSDHLHLDRRGRTTTRPD